MATQSGIPARHHLSAVGGIVAAVCFFLPWIGCPAGELSGADMGGTLWFVLLAAVGGLGLYFHFYSRKELARARLPVGVLSIAGMGLMIIQWLRLLSSEYAGMFRLRFGSIGTLLGFGLVLYGLSQIPSHAEETPAEIEGTVEPLLPAAESNHGG